MATTTPVSYTHLISAVLQLFQALQQMRGRLFIADIANDSTQDYSPHILISDSTYDQLLFRISVDNIITGGSIGNYADRDTDFFFRKLHILSAILRQILIFFDSTDIAFPAGKNLQDRLRSLKLCSRRERINPLAIQLVAYADRDLI